ncbi:MAG TPA: ATP-binding protein [Nitrososphaeraceae archaeon]|nr:ATP-binding protein [Nitrososphaeraceae archaeon]
MTVTSSTSDIRSGRTEVLYGTENTTSAILNFLSNVNRKMDVCADYTWPSVAMGINVFRNALIDTKKRGIRSRYITTITKDNLSFCKEVMKIGELRHLSGVKGGLGVSETQYVATTALEEAKLLTQVIFSSVKELVGQGQYIFDTLWNAAVPAEQKIKEIEEGLLPIRTRLLKNQDEIIREIKRKNNAANKLSICTGVGGLQMSYNYMLDSYKNVVEKSKRQIQVEEKEIFGLRCITNIERVSMNLVKKFLEVGITNIRHIKNMPPLSFGVSDKEVALTIERMEGGKMSSSFLISNELLYVNHFNSLFEELWKNGIDAKERIKDIEEGIDLTDIEIIQNTKEGIKRAWDLIKSARQEVLIMFSTPNSLRRQLTLGGLELLKTVKENNAIIRVLVPTDENIISVIKEIKAANPWINIRVLEENLKTKITIVLVDKKECLIVELKDDTRDNSYSAVGISTYSNSKSIVSSYASIFESFWKQTELYEQLKIHDRMQKEFINIAAHELRTPIQPLLFNSEFLKRKLPTEQSVHIICRNAMKLQTLANNLLDATRIEGGTLKLQKERVNIKDIISDSLQITNDGLHNKDRLKILYESHDIFIEADKDRITQVLSNLLNNAMKFSKEGGKEKEELSVISIVTEMKTDTELVVRIKDTGKGIDPTILPRLFTKFTTRSETGGTGLGLFISKSIVEAHGGRIWAENNNNGIGATFAFSLPLLMTQ